MTVGVVLVVALKENCAVVVFVSSITKGYCITITKGYNVRQILNVQKDNGRRVFVGDIILYFLIVELKGATKNTHVTYTRPRKVVAGIKVARVKFFVQNGYCVECITDSYIRR